MVAFFKKFAQAPFNWIGSCASGWSPLHIAMALAVFCGLFTSVPVAQAQNNLTQADVQVIIARAVNEAIARNRLATIAVTDRVGNVLGIFQMTGAQGFTITSGRGITNSGLEGIALPAAASRAAALAKAVTGAYLSSNGNAFTTRTANQIVQENFNPGETGQPSGPLFGVQISQLPCSDLTMRFVSGSVNQNIGPKRSPLGLAADPGGLPIYKNGVAAGGIGVISDGIYGLDLVITDVDNDDDEMIALAGTVGFQPPINIRAERITVVGKTLRFTDQGVGALTADPLTAPTFAAINGTQGAVVALPGYTDGAIIDGQEFGQPGSGVRADTSGAFGTRPAFILVDGNNNPRFAPRDATDGGLSSAEVLEFLRQGLGIALDGRAQIRRPLDSFIQVTISIVDTNGAILGIARTPDGPIFGTDVSLQKSRTAAFFSNPNAGDELLAATSTKDIASYVTAARALLGPTALADGVAFADRSGGNLARPFFPDGNNNNFNGPFSLPFLQWSPFSTGLQLDLVFDNLIQHVNFLLGAGADTPARCTGLPLRPQTGSNRIPNGIQIFPGSVPIYKNGLLVGGFGVSGDGIDQDDMISFLGTHNAGVILANGAGNAPQNVRADNLAPNGVRLRYVNCPFKPFVGNTIQDPCIGK